MKDLVITQKIFSKEECEKILELPSKLITEDSKEAIEQKIRTERLTKSKEKILKELWKLSS